MLPNFSGTAIESTLLHSDFHLIFTPSSGLSIIIVNNFQAFFSAHYVEQVAITTASSY